jgi:hypothetical protein
VHRRNAYPVGESGVNGKSADAIQYAAYFIAELAKTLAVFIFYPNDSYQLKIAEPARFE